MRIFKILLLFTMMSSVSRITLAKESDVKLNEIEIQNTIQTYVDGYLKAEKNLLEKAFYSETRLYSVDDNRIDQLEMKDWLKNIDDRKMRGDIRKAKLEVKFMDINDDEAMAKIVLVFDKFQSTDYLSLLKIDGDWIIVGKIYSIK